MRSFKLPSVQDRRRHSRQEEHSFGFDLLWGFCNSRTDITVMACSAMHSRADSSAYACIFGHLTERNQTENKLLTSRDVKMSECDVEAMVYKESVVGIRAFFFSFHARDSSGRPNPF